MDEPKLGELPIRVAAERHLVEIKYADFARNVIRGPFDYAHPVLVPMFLVLLTVQTGEVITPLHRCGYSLN